MASLKCYVSISAQLEMDRAFLEELRNSNIEVSFHIKGGRYYPEKLENADFVLFILPNRPQMKDRRVNFRTYSNLVGKGQYDEAIRCCELGKPALVLNNEHTDECYKLILDETRHQAFMENWKHRYGWLTSYAPTSGNFDLYSQIYDIEPNYTRTSNQLSLFDSKYLLLL